MNQISVAIVEDDSNDLKSLIGILTRYQEEKKNVLIDIKSYTTAVSFLDKYVGYDAVFMDIEMPTMNGLEACKKLREIDKNIAIIFITNMGKFAIDGYAVHAFDFILKPINYCSFSFKMDRLTEYLLSYNNKKIEIKSSNFIYQLPLSSIKYIDIYNYKLTYHTIDKNIEQTTKSLQDIEPVLLNNGFYKCSRSLLVNFRYVKGVTENEVNIDGEMLQLSRRRKKEFLTKLTEYLGNINC